MPILRNRSNRCCSVVGIGTSVMVFTQTQGTETRHPHPNAGSHLRNQLAVPPALSNLKRETGMALPTIVCERPVGLGHLVRIFALLDRVALVVERRTAHRTGGQPCSCPRLREFWMSQRRASAKRRSSRISIGTWYVAPPTRRGRTSIMGVALRMACSSASSAGFLVRCSLQDRHGAIDDAFSAVDFLPLNMILLTTCDTRMLP